MLFWEYIFPWGTINYHHTFGSKRGRCELCSIRGMESRPKSICSQQFNIIILNTYEKTKYNNVIMLYC